MAAIRVQFWQTALLSQLFLTALAQPAPPPQVSLLPVPATVPLTGYYTLSFRLRGAALAQHSAFPELEGFRKSGKTSTTTTRVVEGRRFSELTISQRYAAYGAGEFTIPPFQLSVNGVLMRSSGGRVRVLAAAPGAAPAAPPVAGQVPPAAPGPRAPAAVGLLDQLLGKPRPALYTETADRAFLALAAEQRQVYVGEGVRVGLYFYLTPPDQALLAFHDYNEQLPALRQLLRQTGAWVVPAPEAPATPDSVRRGGQLYLRYRLAESIYYPLTTVPLRFPVLALTMTKFRLLTKPEPGVDNRLATYKTFAAPGLSVAVRPLPRAAAELPAAADAPVAVGDYLLQESLSTRRPLVGEAFTYSFAITGRGNLGALPPPRLRQLPGQLDVYGPTVLDQVLPSGQGRKVFRYRLVPRRPGPVRLDSLLALTIFNPRTARYATLRPQLRPAARGVAALPAAPPGRPADDLFYGPALAEADPVLRDLTVYEQVRRGAGLLVLGLLGVAGFGWWRAKVSGPRP